MLAGLVVLAPLSPPLGLRPRAWPPLACEGGWNFVEAKRGLPEVPPLLADAVQSPFGAPLFIGAPQTQPVADSDAYEQLLRAQREGTLVVHIADTRRNFRKAAGSVAVVARVIGLTSGRPGGSLASVTLMGVGRCEVLGLAAGRGRVVTVRVRPYRDEALGERERAETVELCARVRSLWAEVSDRHRALQDIKLQGKLRRLGGPASAALLGIPTEQLADLRAISKGVPLGEAPEAQVPQTLTLTLTLSLSLSLTLTLTPEARRPSAGGIEASLAEAIDLDELVSQVVHLGATSGALRSGEPGSCLAVDGEAAAEEEAAYASTLSLVALRLTSTADAEEEKEDLALSESRRCLARLQLVTARLERRRAQQMVEQSLTPNPNPNPNPNPTPNPSPNPNA